MAELFNRDFILNAGGLQVQSVSQQDEALKPVLRIGFSVERDNQKQPNSADVSIWNLSADSRAFLQDQRGIPVTLEAGYAGNLFQVFSGDMRYAQSSRQGPDWVTNLQAKDGGKAYRTARVNVGFSANVNLADVAKQIAGTFPDVGLGNLEKVFTENFRGGANVLKSGFVASGASRDEFDKVMKAAGLEWSIQDKQIQVLRPAETVDSQIVVLRANTGLIGSPEVGDKGVLKARSLLIPDLFPGKRVKIESLTAEGVFKILKTKLTGDTWGGDWYIDLEAKPI